MKDRDTILLENAYCSILEMRTIRNYNPDTGEYEEVADIRDTPEQLELNNSFIGSGNYRRLACPSCTSSARKEGKKIGGWSKGTAKLNGQEVGAYQCGNCNYVEVYTKRKIDKNREKPTPAQQRVINQIKKYYQSRNQEFEEFDLTSDEHGGFFLTITTKGNIWSQENASFHIGINGKFEVSSVFSVLDRNYKENAKNLQDHLEKMLSYK